MIGIYIIVFVSIIFLIVVVVNLLNGEEKRKQKDVKKLKLLQCFESVLVHDQYGVPRGFMPMELLLCHDGEKYFIQPLVDPRCPIEDVKEAVQEFEKKVFEDPECPTSLDDIEALCDLINRKYNHRGIIHDVKERKQ